MASDNSSNFDQSLHTFQSSVFQKVITDAINFLISSPVEPLPPNHSFPGAGVYLLYYKGSFEPYSPIAEANTKKMNMPIYAGKAVPSGWRQSRSVTNTSPALYNRLKKHARSIQAVTNLNVEDFECRFIILKDEESQMISTVEAEAIKHFKPLWNSLIDGFGNNDPGKNRYGQILSGWDTLHPGRSWETKWDGTRPCEKELAEKIRDYLRLRSSTTAS